MHTWMAMIVKRQVQDDVANVLFQLRQHLLNILLAGKPVHDL